MNTIKIFISLCFLLAHVTHVYSCKAWFKSWIPRPSYKPTTIDSKTTILEILPKKLKNKSTNDNPILKDGKFPILRLNPSNVTFEWKPAKSMTSCTVELFYENRRIKHEKKWTESNYAKDLQDRGRYMIVVKYYDQKEIVAYGATHFMISDTTPRIDIDPEEGSAISKGHASFTWKEMLVVKYFKVAIIHDQEIVADTNNGLETTYVENLIDEGRYDIIVSAWKGTKMVQWGISYVYIPPELKITSTNETGFALFSWAKVKNVVEYKVIGRTENKEMIKQPCVNENYKAETKCKVKLPNDAPYMFIVAALNAQKIVIALGSITINE